MTSSFGQGADALGQITQASSPFFGPSAPVVATIGTAIRGLDPVLNAFGIDTGSGPEKPKKIQKAKAARRAAGDRLLVQQFVQQALAQQNIDIAFRVENDRNKRIFRDQIRGFEDRIKVQKKGFNDAIKIYQKSVDRGIEDFNLADIQSTMAMNDIRRVRNDRVNDIAYKQQQMILDIEAKNLVSFFSDKTLDDQFEIKQLAFEIAKEDNEFALKNAIEQTKLERDELSNIVGAAKAEAGFKLDDIARQTENAVLSANLSKGELALARDDKRAEAAFQTQKARLEGLSNEGKTLASGQTGRSVAKMAQADRFAAASAQNMIAAAMTRADAKYDLDLSKIAQNLRDSRLQAEIKIDGIEQSMNNLYRESENKKGQILNKFAATQFTNTIQAKKLNIQLLQDQQDTYTQKKNNAIDRFNRAEQLKFGLRQLATSAISLDDQFAADRDYNKLRAFFANRSIADNILPQPVAPDAIAPPTSLPDVVRQFTMPFDKEEAYKLHKMYDRAGMTYQPTSPNFLGQLSSLGTEGFKLVQNMQKLVPPSQYNEQEFDAGKFFSTPDLFSGGGNYFPLSGGSTQDIFGLGNTINTQGFNLDALDFTNPLEFGTEFNFNLGTQY